MKSVKMFGKSVPLLTIVMVSVLVIGASAGILAYYGRITSKVTVIQSVLLDGQDHTAVITDTISGVGGDTITGEMHHLTNRAENKIVVKLVTTGTDPAIDAVYPEYRLGAIVEDDFIYVKLDSVIAWSDFSSISFDYLMEQDDTDTRWTPQINLVLRDGDGVGKYYASWHSYRTEITGTEGERMSATYDKDDFYFYELPSWGLIGLWKDVYASYPDAQGLTFDYFSHQAGDTSIDPNNDPNVLPNAALSSQIVWVSNYDVVPGSAIKGIIVHPEGDLPDVLAQVQFRMVFELHPAGECTEQVLTTEVKPLGSP